MGGKIWHSFPTSLTQIAHIVGMYIMSGVDLCTYCMKVLCSSECWMGVSVVGDV